MMNIYSDFLIVYVFFFYHFCISPNWKLNLGGSWLLAGSAAAAALEESA